MRSSMAWLAGTLAGIALVSCGSSDRAAPSPSTAKTPTGNSASLRAARTEDFTRVDSDRDNDVGNPSDNDNDAVLRFGRAASAADRQAIAAIVMRYYAAALAGDGARACSMQYVVFAEAVAEDYGHESPGPTYLQSGKTCPEVMRLLFSHMHAQLAVEVPQLRVRTVRVNKRRGIAVVSFGKLPERQVPLRREGQAWKVEALLDAELP